MELLGSKILTRPTKPVTEFGDNLKDFVNKLIDTMYEYKGRGLAANQVGMPISLFVMDATYTVSKDGSIPEAKPVLLINPEILSRDTPVKFAGEGCLSIPGPATHTTRFNDITVRFQDINGEVHTVASEGLEAIIIQHEVDHLNGKLYIDGLSPLKRGMIVKKFKKALEKIQYMSALKALEKLKKEVV